MSFNIEKRNSIRLYILEKIGSGEMNVAGKAAENFSVSLNTVYRYLRELTDARQIAKCSNGKYSLVARSVTYEISREDFIDELDIYQGKIFPFTEKLPRNVEKIWAYAFCEMMNNVIDHSQASRVQFVINLTAVDTSIVLIDNGIGAFRNIMEKFKMASLDQAIQELFKGKLTTDSEHHSGEGIFFSSRMMDEFAVVSSGKVFSHSKYETIASSLNSIKELKGWNNLPGTIVFMKLSNYSKREIGEVFRAYEDEDYDFIRTIVPVKNLFDSFPVSRSQAKRLCKGFERFKEVILDFRDVEMTGQGFADEIFRVYVNHNPDVKISYINACNEVERMIRHVESRTF